VVDAQFDSVPVTVMIERQGIPLWTRTSCSGESEMCHSLANIEHHHFKYDLHRRPGHVHVHFFGTACLSYSENIRLQGGDVMHVAVEGYGRPLRNPVHIDTSAASPVNVIPLG
jgi:hypothetical protein